MSVFTDYKKEIMDAAHNESLREGVSRSTKGYRANVDNALTKFPHTVELAEEVRQIREKAIGEMEKLAEQACQAIIENRGQCYIAKTADDALTIIGNIIGSNKLIVMGKTMTGGAIGLREYLEEGGNEVWETDMGEFIVQLLKERPMHNTQPALHVPREDVAKLFSKIFGKVSPDIPELYGVARKFLRDKFVQADIGISGANVVAADTGTLFILENEGNIRLATSFPPIHIALVGMDKLVPSFSEACKVAEVTWRYVGQTAPAYTSLISSPSKSSDIEKILTVGVHGPKEFHVIFLDDGRTDLAKHPIMRQALYCVKCGGCLFECPVFAVTAGHFGDKYFSGIGAVWAGMVSKDLEKAAALAYTCLTCGRCKIRCPMKIDMPAMVIELRRLLNKKMLKDTRTDREHR